MTGKEPLFFNSFSDKIKIGFFTSKNTPKDVNGRFYRVLPDLSCYRPVPLQITQTIDYQKFKCNKANHEMNAANKKCSAAECKRSFNMQQTTETWHLLGLIQRRAIKVEAAL